MKGDNFVVMWEDDNGDMVNVEQGGKHPSDAELEDSERTVLAYLDEDGETRYLTILGGFDEYDFTPYDAIEAYISANPDAYVDMMPGQA